MNKKIAANPFISSIYAAEKLERINNRDLVLQNADGKSGGRATIWVRFKSTDSLNSHLDIKI